MISSLLKARRAGHHVLLGVLLAAFPCAQGVAATNWFDPVPSTAPLEGGAGNWADANWKAASNAVSGALWVDGNDAWFQPIASQTNNLGGNAYTAGTLTANSTLGLIALTNGSLAVSRIDSPGNNPLILDLATTSIGAGGVSNINTGSAKVLFLGSNVQLTADQTWVQTSSGGATFSNGTINLGGHTLTLAAYNSATLKGTVTGSGSLVVGGTSAFTFSGTNASSAPTRILSSLALGNSTLYAAGTITNLGQLILSGSGVSFVGSEIVGTGRVVLSSSGTHYLTNANSYSGGTFLAQNSTLWASNASALGSGALVLSNNGTVNFAEFEHTLGEVTVINGTLMNGVLHTPRLMIDAGTVSAGIGGTGAVVKTTLGTVVMSGSNSYSGPTIVALGILSNTASASALPFGSGSLILSNTAMARISPTGSGGALGFLGGTNPGSTFTYDGGATLGLRTGSYTQVSYTFGDGNPSSEVLLRSGRGTLVIYDSAGSGANSLGVDEKFLINGLAPTNINGMVAPTIARIGQGALSASPLFLVYDPTNGFQTANFEKTDFSGSTGTNKVALANSSTHGVAEGQTASAYAIRFGGTGSATVILSNNAALAVGDNASGGFGGISIGNGSSILAASGATNVALAFGASEGVFVLGSGSGVVGVPITGTGGLTKYGYQSGIHSSGAGGNLALVSATSTISGPLSINQGALILSNGAAYLGATTVRALGAIQVFTGSLLQATSDFSLGGSGGLTVYTGGTVNIGGDLLHEGLSSGALALRGGALNVAGQLLQKGGGNSLSLHGGSITVDSLISTGAFGGVQLDWGTLTVSNGFRIAFGGDPSIGRTPFQTFTLNVLGGASNIFTTTSGGIQISGQGNSGSNMTVALNFLGGTSYWSQANNSLQIAQSVGATGLLTVAGPNTLVVGSNRWTLGSAGNGLGVLTVSNGGALLLPNGSSSPAVGIGAAGGRGELVVNNGTLSSPLAALWFNRGSTNGLLMVTNGGRVTTLGVLTSVPSSGFPGGIDASSNLIVVTGPGSVITNGSWTTIGGNTNSTFNRLLVLDGGHYIHTHASYGVSVGGGTNASENLVRVAGEGSLLTAPSISLGTAGGASGSAFEIGEGGTVRLTSDLLIGSVASSRFLMTNGALLEIGSKLIVGPASASNAFLNAGGRLQFTVSAPIVSNSVGTLAVMNGTVAFRGVTAAAVLGQITNIAYSGANTLRLDASSNANTAAYLVDSGQAFSTLEMINAGTLWQGTALTLGSGGALLVSNSAATIASAFTNQGSVRVVNGNLTLSQAPQMNAGASFTLVNATNTLTAGLVIVSNASYGGSGRVVSSVSVTNFGRLAPGNSPGTLSFSSNLALLDSSLLVLEIAGTNAGAYDRLLVDGVLAKGGAVLVTNLGWSFALGDTFDLFDAPSLNGAFADLLLPDLSGGLLWDTSLFETQGLLSVMQVPEPSALIALGIGLGALLVFRRRDA